RRRQCEIPLDDEKRERRESTETGVARSNGLSPAETDHRGCENSEEAKRDHCSKRQPQVVEICAELLRPVRPRQERMMNAVCRCSFAVSAVYEVVVHAACVTHVPRPRDERR